MLLIFIFLLFCCTVTSGQERSVVLHLTTKEGLPSNFVYHCIEDRNGYIWFSTDNGIARFNGYSFTVFNTTHGLPSNDIWRLYEDKKGRIWLFSNTYRFGYLYRGRFDYFRCAFQHQIITPKEVMERGDFLIFDYLVDSEPYTGLFNGITFGSLDKWGLKKTFGLRAAFFGRDTFWGPGYDHDFRYWSPSMPVTTSKTVCNFNHDILHHFTLINDHILDDGKMYMNLSGSNHLAVFNLLTCSFDSINFSSERTKITYPLGRKNIVMTDKAVYQLEKGRLVPMRLPQHILPESLNFYFNDRKSRTWLTSRNGVYFLPGISTWDHWRWGDTVLEQATQIHYADGEVYWWNKYRSELIRTKGNKITDKITLNGMGVMNSVTKTSEELIVCFSSGMYRISKDRKIGQFFPSKLPMIMRNFNVGVKNQPIEYMGDSHRHVYFHQTRITPLNDNSYLAWDKSGIMRFLFSKSRIDGYFLWKGSYDGFIRSGYTRHYIFYGKKQLVISDSSLKRFYEIPPAVLQTAGIQQINAFAGDTIGNLYLLDGSRLLVIDLRTLRLRFYRIPFAVADTKLLCGGKFIVMVNASGIAVYHTEGKATLRLKAYKHNFKGMDFGKVNEAMIEDNGVVTFRTDRGIFSIPIDSVLNAGLHVTDHHGATYVVNTIEPKRLKNHDTVFLDQPSNRINTDLINFHGAGEPEFRYRINSDAWQSSRTGDIFLDAMKPGTYYNVDYYATDKHWKGNRIRFYIYIRPYWYQTSFWRTLFWLVGIVLFGTALYTVYAFTRRNMIRANEQRRLQTELELRAIHSQINPHFIFNTLSTALYFISKQENKKAYEHVNKFSKLLRGYLRSSRDRWITLAEEIVMLEQYVELQKARFHNKFSYRIETDPALHARNIVIPSLLLQPLVENAINHGLFNRTGDGTLSIRFLQGSNARELVCIIEDNGIGREKSRELRSRQKNPAPSFGTQMTTELIDTLRKFEQMEISLQYEDRQEPETGTVVILTIGKVKLAGDQTSA